MTKEEKELLLKDLCARLPYNVMVHVEVNDVFIEPVDEIATTNTINMLEYPQKFRITPYLRPMSSMTEEESEELESITFPLMVKDWDGNENSACIREIDIPRYMDFILSHHFDYRGLIEKGLALEAPKDMYK